jgi:hypothetical protein
MRILLIILGILAVIIIGLRVYLPFFIKDQIEKNINEVEGLSGSAGNVSLSVLAGHIQINDLVIYDEEYPDPSRPFIFMDHCDIDADWQALFNRKLVARVDIDSLTVNYVIHEVEVEEVDFVGMLRELMDFQIDVNITNSTFNYADVTADPNIEFSLNDIFVEGRYLINEVVESDSLPSSLAISASLYGKGSIESNIRINYMQDIPDFDFELEIENADLTDFNEITKEHGGFELSSGLINVYTEAAAHEGAIKGYVKPVLEEIEVIPSEEEAGVFKQFYESVLDFAASILESPDEDHIATNIEFEGRIDDPEVEVWQAVWNLLRNAFVEGFSKGLEGIIDFEELIQNN